MFETITSETKYVWINNKMCVKLNILECFEICQDKKGLYYMAITDHNENAYDTEHYKSEKELLDVFNSWFK